MKQFNLEEYLKNPSGGVVTRDGKCVRIVCTDRLGAYPVIGLVKTDNVEKVTSYTDTGRIYSEAPSEYDLFFTPNKKEGWVNVYCEDNLLWCGNVYNTESEAKQNGRYDNRLATVKIEWEE